MDDMRILVTDTDDGLNDRLQKEIYRFNGDATELRDGRTISIRLDDASGELMAGLTGWTWGGTGYIDVLWVRADARHKGLGNRMLAAAEAEATARGCTQMVLSTHSFQAPDFYQARGYIEYGRTPNYPVGHSHIHLRKRLTASS
jgi:ribosomal protein S18 acetylase RimI-like enzyme